MPLDSAVEVDFSEEMDTRTLRLSSVPSVSFSLASWTAESHRALFRATAALAQGTRYTLSIEGRDLASNPIEGAVSFAFTTVSVEPDTTPPVLLTVSPMNGEAGVPRDGVFRLTFSEPMNMPSVEKAFVVDAPTMSRTGTFSWNASGSEVVFDPDTDFAYAIFPQWHLTSEATDLAGNHVTEESGSFRVIRSFTRGIDLEQPNTGLIYDTNMSANASPWIIGDDLQNKAYRAGLSFSLTGLNEQLTRFTAAKLVWPYTSLCGSPSCNPFSQLGPLAIDSISYGDTFLPEYVWYTARIGAPVSITSESELGVEFGNYQASVLPLVTEAWTNRVNRSMRVQFRLRFESLTNHDSQPTSIEIDQTRLYLLVSYEQP